MNAPGRPPIPISRNLDVGALCREDPCDVLHVLGSFWPYSNSGFDSRVAKAFKECVPMDGYLPHAHRLCEFYAERVLEAVGSERFEWVARVLGSSETEPDSTRPQNALADAILRRSGALDAKRVFFKSGPRPPMRTVRHLSGPEALRTRITYAAQDLFVRPADLQGTALLIDDIMNTGASVRVYADALKRHCGIERIVCVNLAVTRFGKGRDGWGMLRLETSPLTGELGAVWVDQDGLFHTHSGCCDDSRKRVEIRFLAEKSSRPCPVCIPAKFRERRWWEIWRGQS